MTAQELRSAARAAGQATYFTGVPCKNGHVGHRQTASATCLACKAKFRAERRDLVSQSNRAYYRSNKSVYAANTARRRAVRLTGTPPWVDMRAVAAVYAEARRLTEETGIPHDVDHIIPLQGNGVCGLHVPWNLRPLPASVNRSKRNRV